MISILAALLPLGGCARDRGRPPREITPTTLGTDLSKLPRGQMRPYPWPGQSIAEGRPKPTPTVDPEAATASGVSDGR